MIFRFSMLLKSRPSPEMLPFSVCNKKRLAIRHINRPLFPKTLSIPSYDIGTQVGLRTYQHPSQYGFHCDHSHETNKTLSKYYEHFCTKFYGIWKQTSGKALFTHLNQYCLFSSDFHKPQNYLEYQISHNSPEKPGMEINLRP